MKNKEAPKTTKAAKSLQPGTDGEVKSVSKRTSPKKALRTPVSASQDDGSAQSEAISISKGKKAAFPAEVKPMLATLVDEPINEPGWMYEVKWDGYRSLALMNEGQVELKSRNNKSFNEKFYPVYDALLKLGMNAVLDGEIVVVTQKGVSRFRDLQQWRSEADGELVYYVFDLLWLNGIDLMGLPVAERRSILRQQLPPQGIIRMSETFEASGTDFFAMAKKMGLEGIIAKKTTSQYVPGLRSKEWLKIKSKNRQEVVIGGYTQNEGSSRQFSALLVGAYKEGVLHFATPVGTGFTNAMQTKFLEQAKALIIPECPFSTVPEYNKPSRFRPHPPKASVTWLRPELVCEVSYLEITADGAMRHPSFEGLREDKKAREVIIEREAHTPELLEEHKTLADNKIIVPSGDNSRKSLLNPKDETQVRSINGHDLKFTNLSKIFWPAEKITKRDMLNYYYQVVPYMLPYMKDRPQSLNRHPHGIEGESFYQKNVTGKVPSWIKTFPYHSERDGRDKNFLVCTDEASLLFIASLGCIEMNPWSSRFETPDHPDWCIIDLDPDKNTFNQVIEAARVTKKVLDALDVPACCKTSGSTGLHIYIPLGAKYTYEDSKEFARIIVKIIHAEIPAFTSIERLTEKREGKMYLDFLQNRPQATIAAPYSLRPKPGATVSAPLHWDEVKKGLCLEDFTIDNMADRLKKEGDLFKLVLEKGINLEETLKKIKSVYGEPR